MDEYLKWAIVLLVLRALVESVVQAFLIRKKKITCDVDNDDEIGYVWRLSGL